MKFLQLTLLAAVFQLSQQANVERGIANGVPAQPTDQSYQVRISTYYLSSSQQVQLLRCTGSVISDTHILIARLCVEPTDSTTLSVEVVLGEPELGEGQKIECRNCWTIYADMAIITMPHVVTLPPPIQIIELPTWSDVDSDYTGRTASVSGWGQTNNNELTFYEKTVVIATQEECESLLADDPYQSEVQICAITEYSSISSASTCEESSGPLVIDGKVVAIINIKECYKNEVNMAYKVTNYLKWISEVTGIEIKK